MLTGPTVELVLAYESLLQERDRIRAEMPPGPPSVDQHVGIAIFEAWADGIVGDAHVLKQIAKFHANPSDCRVCLDNLEYYQARRNDMSREGE